MTLGCGCCSFDISYPINNFERECGDHEATPEDLDGVEAYVRQQLELVAEMRKTMQTLSEGKTDGT